MKLPVLTTTKQMESMSAASALKAIPASESPLTVERASSGGHGLNTLRAVLDHAPYEIDELGEEIAELSEKMRKLKFQQDYLKKLYSVAQEYYDQRER